jgi:UDP-N-acetylglucosamine acyltransferase
MSVHSSAIVHPEARLASGVSVGAFSIIGAQVEIGSGTEVMSHVVIDGRTTLGKDNRVYPFASIGLAPQDLKYKGEPTRVEIGDSNSIREFVTIHRGTAEGEGITRIGSHNLLMAYVHVAHDCLIGNHVIMANCATLAGHVTIYDHATVGALSAVHQFCRIGGYSFLGSGTMVTQDILPYSKTSVPRPSQVYGTNRIGLERRGLSAQDLDELDVAFRLLIRSKLNTSQALEAIQAKGFKSAHVATLVEFVKTSARGVIK